MSAVKLMAAVLAAGLLAGPAAAQEAPASGTPPSWDILVHCAGTADEDARLACYDTAMHNAGYAPKPAEVAAVKRHRFGLSMPDIRLLRRHAKEEGTQSVPAAGAPAAGSVAAASKAAPSKAPVLAAEDDPDRVTVTLDLLAFAEPSHRMILFTTDGAVWSQKDDEVVTPRPKSGQMFVIRRNSFGGYFCQFDKFTAVRCERKR